ncbi:acetyltransferase [Janthinobacterium fluminis]|uniref:Acetyltransferase n=1 Tax=Janthinobacterium fluminis TaxID=2987524 RepID=A0ABT5K1N9_9BURK|nr:acetyltransferase [Janthinobacterium fluminis]MDC8758885.1 acetyltransferase [Janthinobacterium fluminis]
MTLPVIIVGAGGHAAVVADALLAAGAAVLGFTDTDPARHGRVLCGLPVLGDDAVLARYERAGLRLANGLGGLGGETPPLRARVQERLEAQGWQFCGVRHPGAIVSPFARLGAAVQLMAGCVVQPGAELGAGCIVNTGAIVEHDACIGAWSHLAPRAVVCGQVRIGAACHVGAGATVRQDVRLGAATLVGAGAVVVKNFSGGGVLLGTPARPWEQAK